jgi:hypothetical protein
MNASAIASTANSGAARTIVPSAHKTQAIQHSKFAVGGTTHVGRTTGPNRGSVTIKASRKEPEFTVSMSLNDSQI